MSINTYLNDLSLQLPDDCKWNEVFDCTMACLQIFSQIKLDENNSLNIVINPDIFTKIGVLPNISFTNLLRTDRERKKAFTSIYKNAILQFLFPKGLSTYWVDKLDVTGTVIADSYESQKSSNITFLINFNSNFPTPIVEVVKDKDGTQSIFSYNSAQELTNKLQELKLLPIFYDRKSKIRPNESLTILADKSLFTPTKFGNRNNRLFRRNDKPDELWCLDRLHIGNSIHLEVFSESSKKQIAVSSHDKINFFRKLTESEKNRTLEMNPMP